MDIVLGVSMAPTAVRMVLVEGESGDGITVDHNSFDIAGGTGGPEQVLAAILGTRESAVEGGHHVRATGVAWTDHAAAARLSQALRAHGIDDVVLVSELHAAGALAQAIGQTLGYDRTALLFVEHGTATLAVVRASDGAVVQVMSRGLHTPDPVTELAEMAGVLQTVTAPPKALFVVGSGVDIAALKAELAGRTTLPVHAPEDGELALARGAGLAAATAPRYEASTVGLASADDTLTAAGATQLAAAGYMAPLGYSAVPDDDDDLDFLATNPVDDHEPVDSGRKPFLLVGSALSTVFVFGIVALAVSLVVAIRPTADQRPDTGVPVPAGEAAPTAQQAQKPVSPGAPETIQAPIPVVQEAPRTV
ncbi:MAG: DUF7159 family protein, partial [Mycobacterium sp.]